MYYFSWFISKYIKHTLANGTLIDVIIMQIKLHNAYLQGIYLLIDTDIEIYTNVYIYKVTNYIYFK